MLSIRARRKINHYQITMRKPFYLGIRSLVLFESALREVSRDALRALLNDAAAGKAESLDTRKIKLVEAELSRRETGDACAWIAIIIAVSPIMTSL